MVKKSKKNKKSVKVKKVRSKSVDSGEAIRKTRIRVIGIGGGGDSIVAEIAPLVKRVDFVAANTDLQALREAGKKIRSGSSGGISRHLCHETGDGGTFLFSACRAV